MRDKLYSQYLNLVLCLVFIASIHYSVVAVGEVKYNISCYGIELNQCTTSKYDLHLIPNRQMLKVLPYSTPASCASVSTRETTCCATEVLL